MIQVDAAGSNLHTYLAPNGDHYIYDPANELPDIGTPATIHISGGGFTTGDYPVLNYVGGFDGSSQGAVSGSHNFLRIDPAAVPVSPFPANANALTSGAWQTGRGNGITCVNKAVWLGDSITAGYSTTNPPTTSHPNISGATLPQSWVYDNLGVAGRTAAFMAQEFPTVTGRQLAQATGHKILVILAGINDLNGGAAATDVQASLSQLVTLGKNAGAMVVLGTILHEGNAPGPVSNPKVDTINAWIRAGTSGADYIADYFARPTLADPANTAYYSDTLHPNDAGQREMAAVDASILSTILSIYSPTDPYRSDNSNTVAVLANFKPDAPSVLVATGLGTFLLPSVHLAYLVPANLPGGKIHFLRRLYQAGTTWAEVGFVAGADANTAPPAAYVDMAVINGVKYEYTAYATPYGDNSVYAN